MSYKDTMVSLKYKKYQTYNTDILSSVRWVKYKYHTCTTDRIFYPFVCSKCKPMRHTYLQQTLTQLTDKVKKSYRYHGVQNLVMITSLKFGLECVKWVIVIHKEAPKLPELCQFWRMIENANLFFILPKMNSVYKGLTNILYTHIEHI